MILVNIDDHVKVKFRDLEFNGIVVGITFGGYIIQPDVMSQQIQNMRHDTLDPKDCIVIHGSYIVEKLPKDSN